MAALLFMGATVLAACSTPGSLAAPQAQTLRSLGFRPTDEGWELDLSGRLTFALNDASLSSEALLTVAHVAKSLLAVGIAHVTVDGHTDDLGTEAYNQDLSKRRADAVAAAFIAQGFASANIRRRWFGYRRPIADNATEAGRQQNRRVAIIVESA